MNEDMLMNVNSLREIWEQHQFPPFTRDDVGYREWVEYTQRAYRILVRAAQSGQLITYGQIGAQIGLYSPEYFALKIGSIVGACSLYEQRSGRPLISAIAVNGETQQPGEGFWGLAAIPQGADRDRFWAEEVRRVFQTWQA